MRAARLLKILLLLQQDGRRTSSSLAEEMEVSARTIWRDVDALTEAGIPVIAHRGNTGGISLAFNFRTDLTGLDREEARALALMLRSSIPFADELGLGAALASLRLKMLESLPAQTRQEVGTFDRRVDLRFGPARRPDARLGTLLYAIDRGYRIRAEYRQGDRVDVIDFRPIRLELGARVKSLMVEVNGCDQRVDISRLDNLTLSRTPV